MVPEDLPGQFVLRIFVQFEGSPADFLLEQVEGFGHRRLVYPETVFRKDVACQDGRASKELPHFFLRSAKGEGEKGEVVFHDIFQ